MLPQLAKIKGIHPGLILKRELERNNIKSSLLAMEIKEHKQTISAIVNKKRGINPELSIKLANYFHTEADYFMLLQASYDVNKKLETLSKTTPNLNNFRKVLFWDTSFDKIDWDKNKTAIIKRVLERGNEQEKEEIKSFYGKSIVDTINNTIKKSPSFTRSFNKKRKQRIE
ncbi:HigA family addiction module antitoxin [Wenyingzhuangia sp. IMCC45467]